MRWIMTLEHKISGRQVSGELVTCSTTWDDLTRWLINSDGGRRVFYSDEWTLLEQHTLNTGRFVTGTDVDGHLFRGVVIDNGVTGAWFLDGTWLPIRYGWSDIKEMS